MVHRLKKVLQGLFTVKDTGKASIILGMIVTRDYNEGTLTTMQKNYVQGILEGFERLISRLAYTSCY